MDEINRLLNYKVLKIVQNTDWFKFSIDSVLLSNFVKITKNTTNIIDFCTGNAPIPLILSTKTRANITGVEIQKDVYNLAKKSIEINNLQDRIKILNMDVKDIAQKYESDSFDLITCNPPYFKLKESSIINDNDIKSVARHEIYINLDDIFKVDRKILKNNAIESNEPKFLKSKVLSPAIKELVDDKRYFNAICCELLKEKKAISSCRISFDDSNRA